LAIAPNGSPPALQQAAPFLGAAPAIPAQGMRQEDTGRIERNAMRALLAVAPTEVLEPDSARRTAEPAVGSTFVRLAPVEAPAGRARTVRAPKPAAVIARGRRRTAAGLAASASAVAAATVGVLVPMQQADLRPVEHSADVASAVPLTATPAAAPIETPASTPAPTATAAPAVPEVAAPDQAESRGEYTVAEFTADAVAETVPPPPTTTPSAVGTSAAGGVDAAGHESGVVAGGWAAPIDSSGITDYYGPRWGRMHNGIDLNASIGSPLYAVGAGTVTFAGPQGSYGNHIEITLDDGTVVTYSHLSSIGASVGQSVAAGEYIGAAGNTGNSTGPHLHFEVRIGGSFTDPLPWLADRGITYRSLI